jgi:glycosyltransferase involved in cell wall biosynthesis
VVNLHFPEPRFASLLRMRLRHKFRLVISLHGDDVERCFNAASTQSRDGLRAFLQQADAVTTCSQYLLDRAVALEPSVRSKGRAIHNAVDVARFHGRDPHAHPRPYILAYGRHTRKKGFDLLLESFAAIAPQFPDVDLILAGDGEERAALEQKCQALAVRERALFFGRASSEEITRLLQGCRLAVIPSREEPFGIAALEAILAGCLVVATRVGGLPELVAAAGVSCSGDNPAVRWSEPDTRDLARVLSEALAAPLCPAVPRAAGAFSIESMTRAFLSVLDGGTPSRTSAALAS